MATTERDVFEALRSLDTSFLDDYKPYNDDYATTIKFHENKKIAQNKYFKALSEVSQLMKDCLIDVKSEFLRNVGGRDGDDYYNYDLYIGGVHVGRAENVSEYYSGFSEERRIEYAEEFIKEYEQNYEKNKNRLDELTASPELAEYNNLVDELNNLQSQNRIIERLKNANKVKQIKKRLEELKKYADEYNNLKSYVDEYKDAHKVVENLPKLKKAIQKRDDLHNKLRVYENDSRWNEAKEYLDYKNAEKQVAKRDSNAKDFKLVKFYREHEAEFANTRNTLLMIYQGIVGEKYLKNFKDLLVAYDQAAVIAKEEGKDFATLKEAEQFEYFEAAQKVVEANNKFNAHKEGGGKE